MLWWTVKPKKAAERGELEVQSLIPDSKIQMDCEPRYSKEYQKLVEDLGGKIEKGGWAKTPQGKIIISFALLWTIVIAEHRKSHWGAEALYKYVNRCIVAQNLYATVKQVTQQCEICLQNNPKVSPKAQPRQIGRGN